MPDQSIHSSRSHSRRSVAGFALSVVLAGLLAVWVLFPPSGYSKKTADAPKRETADFMDLKDVLSLPDEEKLIIDLRTRAQFDYAHIPSSINLPEPWSVPQIEAILRDSTRKIIIVSLRNSQGTGVSFHGLLKGLKAEQVFIYSGGWDEWKSCRLPVERSHE